MSDQWVWAIYDAGDLLGLIATHEEAERVRTHLEDRYASEQAAQPDSRPLSRSPFEVRPMRVATTSADFDAWRKWDKTMGDMIEACSADIEADLYDDDRRPTTGQEAPRTVTEMPHEPVSDKHPS